MKILFCTDGSETSFSAIRQTLPFINTDCQVDIAYVIEKKFISYIHSDKEIELFHKDLANKILNKTSEIIETEGFNTTNKYTLSGHPASEIIDLSKREKYDLITLGSHGKKGLKKWLGSVSHEVVVNSCCPALVSKHNEKVQEFNKNVLVAVDDSDCSLNAVKKFIETINLNEASIEILTVTDSPESIPSELIMDEDWLKEFITQENKIATETLEKFKKLFEENNINVKKTVHIEGFVTEDIIKYTETNPIDLLVIGTQGRGEITSFLLGSIGKRVLEHSTVPVLIIPNKSCYD